MNTRPTNAGGEVAPPDGYTADTSHMSSAVRNVGNAVEDARSELVDFPNTQLTAADFGRKHGQHHKDYVAAIAQLGKSATEMCDNLSAFVEKLGDTGRAYSETEARAADAVTAPRGRQ